MASVCLIGQNNNPYLDYQVMNPPIEQAANGVNECEGQRDEINSNFDPDQISELADLIMQYLTSEINPNYNEGSDPTWLKYKHVAAHWDFNNGGASAWHMNNEFFFSWHRDYIQGIEQFLLEMGHPEFVPLPSWDPSSPMPVAFQTAVVDGVSPLNNSGFQANMYDMNGIACDEFDNIDEFAGWIRQGVNPPNSGNNVTNHNLIHGGLGGAMGDPRTASGAAIFWLFHAHVDELYQCYQTRCQDCAPVFIRATGLGRNCDYCFDFSLNENANNISVTLIDDSGNEISIPWPTGRTCIPFSHLQSGKEYTAIISATNATDINCNAADQVEIQFIAPVQPRATKFGNPCLQIIAQPNFPIPDNSGNRNFTVTNTGLTRNFSFIQTQAVNGQSIILSQNVRIDQDESIQITIPRNTTTIGYNIFSIIVDDQTMDIDYIIID